MLNMSKNVCQSEIDAACELIDFFRFQVLGMRMNWANTNPCIL